MTYRNKVSALCAGLLLLAACGGGDDSADTTVPEAATTVSSTGTTGAAPSTTTTVAPSTTVPQTTTTAGSTGQGDMASLIASLNTGSEPTSGRMEGSFEVTGLSEEANGLTEGTIYFSSVFDTASGNSTFTMDMSSMMDSADFDEDDPFAEAAAGMFTEIEVREIGDTSYIKFPFFAAMSGADTEWISMPAEEGEEFSAEFDMSADPMELVEELRDSSATVELVGPDAVNGVDATHYRLLVDGEELDSAVPDNSGLGDPSSIGSVEVPVSLWVSDDGYIVRMVMEFDGSAMDAAAEDEFETMTVTYDILEINGDVVIEPPPADQVTDMSGLEGGFGSGGG